MRRIGAILFGILVGGGLVFAAFQLHVVRAAEGLVIVPKQQPVLTDAFADIRDWSRDDWQQHPVLVQNLIADGRSDLVAGSMTEGMLRDLVSPLFNKID